MRKVKNILWIAAFACLLIGSGGCLRLDSFAFSGIETQEYLLDAFDNSLFYLDPSYDIPDSLIEIFPLSSQTAEEDTPKEIYAVYVGDQARISTDTVILYLHGNFGHMDYYWQRTKLLANMGGKNRFGVLMIDYRGFGRSEGPSTEDGMYADAQAALDWLQGMGLSDDRLIIYGFSMGTGPTAYMTNHSTSLKPAKIAMEAPYASFEVMGNDATGLALPGSFIANLRLANAEEIKTIDQPFFWIHGTEDGFLAIDTHGEVVFKNYKGSRGVAVRVPGGHHSDIPEIMGYEEYLASFLPFVLE